MFIFLFVIFILPGPGEQCYHLHQPPAVPTYYIVLQQTRPTLEPTSCISTLATNESNIADPILHMKNPKVTYGKIWAETRKY